MSIDADRCLILLEYVIHVDYCSFEYSLMCQWDTDMVLQLGTTFYEIVF